jgi:hypothetical protein
MTCSFDRISNIGSAGILRVRLACARAQECQFRGAPPECRHCLGPQHTGFGVRALVITNLTWASNPEPTFVCDGRVVPRREARRQRRRFVCSNSQTGPYVRIHVRHHPFYERNHAPTELKTELQRGRTGDAGTAKRRCEPQSPEVTIGVIRPRGIPVTEAGSE